MREIQTGIYARVLFSDLTNSSPGTTVPNDDNDDNDDATGLILTTLKSSDTRTGVTINTDVPMPMGTFEDGSLFIVSDRVATISDVAPASDTVTNGFGTFWRNGLMIDPLAETAQGYDGRIGRGNASADIPYTHELNRDPAAVGSGISITVGMSASLVKAISIPTIVDGDWQTIQSYAVITIVPTAPPVGSYRPGIGPGEKVQINKNTFNPSCLRSIVLPAAFTDTTATVISRVPAHIPAYGDDGDGTDPITAEQVRRLRTDGAINASAPSNYSAAIVPAYSEMLLQLHRSGLSVADRDTILARTALIASDFAMHIRAGRIELGGAGQGGAMQQFVYAAAILFDLPDLLADARAQRGNMHTNTPLWVTAESLLLATPGKSGDFAQAFQDEQVGQPWNIPDEVSGTWGRYTNMAGLIGTWEMGVVSLFLAGADVANGLAAILNGPNDTTNQRASAIAFLSRYRRNNPSYANSYVPTAKSNALYDLTASLVSGFEYVGPPSQLPIGPNITPYFSAGPGDGAIQWDITGFEHNNPAAPITRVDVRVSRDRRSWQQFDSVASPTGNISDLLRGTAYYCQIRRHNANGASPWSQNHPEETELAFTDLSIHRHRITTTGTATAAAPVLVTAPALMRNTRPGWKGVAANQDWFQFEPVAWVDGDATAHVGDGIYTGFPAPTFTYQWERFNGTNWVAIAGATAQDHTFVNADYLQQLRCQVTATNASGSVTTPSNAYTCLTFVPGNSLSDDFSTNTSANWPTVDVNNALSSVGVSRVWDSSGALEVTIDSGTGFAGVRSLNVSVVDGQQYTVSLTVRSSTGGASSFEAILFRENVSTQAGNAPISTNRISGPSATTATRTYTFTANFTGQAQIIIRNRPSNGAVFLIDNISFTPV